MTIAEALPRCPDFRWMAGMLVANSPRFGAGEWRMTSSSASRSINRSWSPDLTDPATIGCLLVLVRIAYDDPTLSPVSDGRVWAVVIYDAATDSEVTVSEEYGEGEALAVALLAKSDPRWWGPHGEFVRVRLVP